MCMVTDNMSLVGYILKKHYFQYHNSDIWEDLYQEGCEALVKAAKTYDETLGYTFSTYACSYVLNQIRRYLRDVRPMFRSGSHRDYINKIRYQLFKNPYLTSSDIADMFNISIYDAEECIGLICGPCSLSKSIYTCDDRSMELLDLIADKQDDYQHVNNKLLVNELLVKLDTKTKTVFIMYYMHNMTQAEIAVKMNTSQVQVSRYLKKGLIKLGANIQPTNIKRDVYFNALDTGKSRQEAKRLSGVAYSTDIKYYKEWKNGRGKAI